MSPRGDSGWQSVDEPILVHTRFDSGGRVQPMAFVWDQRTWSVAEWGRQWLQPTERAAQYRCFLIRTASGDTFEIRLDLCTLAWRLRRTWLQPRCA